MVMKSGRQGRRLGFSLLELIVVSGILVSSLLFFMASILGSRNLTNESSEKQQARMLALARIGQLRTLLRDADLIANHDAQYQKVLDEDTSAGTPTLPTVGQLQWAGATWQATITTETFRSGTGGLEEVTANALLPSLELINIDVNADGDTNDADVPVAQLEMIPVIITITWRGANDKPAPAPPGHTMRLAAILY